MSNVSAGINYRTGSMSCFSRMDAITSNNKAIVDFNRETCSKDIKFNVILVKPEIKSSLKVRIWLKNSNNKAVCEENFIVYSNDNTRCNDLEKRHCKYDNIAESLVNDDKRCDYICENSLISKVTIMETPHFWANNIEICEISTTALDRIYDNNAS